jgi:hypothetical protein
MLNVRSATAYAVPLQLEKTLWEHVSHRLQGFTYEELSTSTLYLDTAQIDIYRGVRNDLEPKGTRKQLRVRTYASGAGPTHFFEFKWRDGGISHKRREKLARDLTTSIQDRDFRPADSLLATFWDELLRQTLIPRLIVRYRRRALQSATQRVTLDTSIEYSMPGDPSTVVHSTVAVLELKTSLGQAPPTDVLEDFIDQMGSPISKCAEGLQIFYSDVINDRKASTDSKVTP